MIAIYLKERSFKEGNFLILQKRCKEYHFSFKFCEEDYQRVIREAEGYAEDLEEEFTPHDAEIIKGQIAEIRAEIK